MTIEKINLEAAGGRSFSRLPQSFLQTPFWARFKESHGWKASYFLLDGETPLTVLIRPLFRFASIAYVPLGPALSIEGASERAAALAEISRALRAFLPKSVIAVRFDPPWGTTTANTAEADGPIEQLFPEPLPRPARKASADVQPPDTVILDLSLSSENLLAAMKPKWRYNVKLAEKKGVEIRSLTGMEGANEGIDAFYELYLETARRDGIAVHDKAYYRDLIARAADYRSTDLDNRISARVYLAEHEGKPIAAIVTLFSGEEATYLYGASSNEKRNLMPAYALQWQAIRDAAEWGCARYDFYGIPPTDDPAHPMHGLWRFKTGFGGSIVHRVGSWDLPERPILYAAYRLAEKARAFWFKKAVKRLRGIRRTS